jgi:hypothetical protein
MRGGREVDRVGDGPAADNLARSRVGTNPLSAPDRTHLAIGTNPLLPGSNPLSARIEATFCAGRTHSGSGVEEGRIGMGQASTGRFASTSCCLTRNLSGGCSGRRLGIEATRRPERTHFSPDRAHSRRGSKPFSARERTHSSTLWSEGAGSRTPEDVFGVFKRPGSRTAASSWPRGSGLRRSGRGGRIRGLALRRRRGRCGRPGGRTAWHG